MSKYFKVVVWATEWEERIIEISDDVLAQYESAEDALDVGDYDEVVTLRSDCVDSGVAEFVEVEPKTVWDAPRQAWIEVKS